ncbi:MAG: DUF975 family protein [Chloroflexi bacterium]|nr:DUF975 family protein [Chloroflexota bacterium]
MPASVASTGLSSWRAASVGAEDAVIVPVVDSPASPERVIPSNKDRFASTAASGPRAASTFGGTHLDEVVIDATVAGAYRRAFRTFGGSFGVLLVAGTLAVIIGSVVGWVVGLALQAIGETQAVSPIATVCNLATQALVVTPLSNGWQYVCLRVVRGQAAAVGDLFEPYRGRLFVTAMSSLVQALLVALSSLPVAIAFVVVVMTGVVPLGGTRLAEGDVIPFLARIGAPKLIGLLVGLIAVLIPPFIVSVRLSLMSYLVIDEGRGPLEAAAVSWSRSRGSVRLLAGVTIAGGLLIASGMIVFVIGMVPALVVFFLAHAAAFAAVTTRQAAEQASRRPTHTFEGLA